MWGGDLGDVGPIPGSERPPGEGNGKPLQYSCLKNPMDRGAWRATKGLQRVEHTCVRAHACTHTHARTHTHTHTHKGTAHVDWTSWSSGMYLGYTWVSAMWAYGPAHSLTLSSVGWG